ncbi:MAG: hypothetical protein NVS1B7_7710 [Candidatus Saccharimonadales bacterium]
MYHWQDVVLAVCIFGFNVALVPSVLSKQKPAIPTSVLTASFQVTILTVYINLHLWYSAVMSLINATLWSILGIQKYQYIRRVKH